MEHEINKKVRAYLLEPFSWIIKKKYFDKSIKQKKKYLGVNTNFWNNNFCDLLLYCYTFVSRRFTSR